MSTLAFLGLGNMGLPMACNLFAAGHRIHAHDPCSRAREAARGRGLTVVAELDEALHGADVVFTMVPEGTIVLDILARIGTIAEKPDLVIDCSTIDIGHARQAHRLAVDAGFGFLDAPVSGGIAGAAAGSLTIMVGGEGAVLDRASDFLEPLSTRVIHCGDGGSGQAAKICNNMLLAISMIGTAEAFILGDRLGLDRNILFDVLSTSTGACWSVTHYCPLPGVGPISPADNDYKPGFPASLMVKDLALTQAAAESVGQATPLGEQSLALYREFVTAGSSDKDFSAIIDMLRTRLRT